jgi:hypothetical protein
MAGATPKLKKSARLSSWAPILLVLCRMRAELPSSPSSTAATRISDTASSQRWSSA